MKTIKQLLESSNKTYSVISHDVASREDEIPWHPTNYKVHGHKLSKITAHTLAHKVRQANVNKLSKRMKLTLYAQNNSFHIINLSDDEDNGENGIVHSVHVVKD